MLPLVLSFKPQREEVAVDGVSFVEIEKKEEEMEFVPRKLIIVVTPTYNRAMQAYYLNKIAHTLRLVESPVLLDSGGGQCGVV
ncbi:hypothetical protein YC2023_109586 [Brassica napus]